MQYIFLSHCSDTDDTTLTFLFFHYAVMDPIILNFNQPPTLKNLSKSNDFLTDIQTEKLKKKKTL